MILKKSNQLFSFLAFIVIFLFSTSDARAFDASSLCGMQYTATEGTQIFPYKVDPKSFEICENDLSYKMLYMLYGASMDSELSQQLFHIFHKPDEKTLLAAEISPTGRVVKTIYSSFTHLFFTIFLVILGFQTIKYIHHSQSTGQFLGSKDEGKKTANVVLTSLIVIALATPVGSILLIQALIIALSVPAIMLANYFMSGFLANVQTETTRVQVSDELLRINSDTYATEQLFGQLCEDQTQQAIINHNYISGGAYSGGFFRRLFRRDDPMEYLQLCNTYTDTLDTNDTGLLTSITSEIRYQNCDFHRYIPRVFRFKGGGFGSNHQCSTTNYTQPDSVLFREINTRRGKALKDETLNDLTLPKNQQGQFFKNFSFYSIKNKIITTSLRLDLINLKTRFEQKEIDEIDYNEQLTQILNREAENFKNNYLIRHQPIYRTVGEGADEREEIVSYDAFDNTGGLLSISMNDALAIGNNKEVFSLIYMRHLSALNKALGAYVMPTDDYYEANRFVLGSGLGLKNKRYERDIKKLHDGVDFTGTEHIRVAMGVRETSKNIIAKNCIDTLSQHSDGFRFYNSWESNNRQLIDGSTTPTMSCIHLDTPNRNEVRFTHALENMPFFNDIRYLRNDQELFDYSVENKSILENEAEKLETITSDKMMQLSAYNYIVRKAFTDSLAIELKRNADFKVLSDTRGKGWAGLGSMMMAISAEQSSAVGFSSTMLNTGSPQSYYRVEEKPTLGTFITAVNADVFNFAEGQEFNDILNQSSENVKGIVKSSSLIGLTSFGQSGQAVSSGNYEFSILQKVLSWLIEFVFNSPLTYLKQGSGMDVYKSVPENLADCAVNGDCYPKTTHPLNATIMFGQGLLANSFMAIVILIVVKGIAETLMREMQDQENKKGNSSASKAQKLLGNSNFIFMAVKFVAYLILIISPLLISAFSMMMFPAVLLGYMLPIIPYMMVFIVIISWFILIFTKTLTFPINLLAASKIREDGESEITIKFFWSKLGDIFIKPSLITMAIVFSWVLVNISIYYINTVMFTVFELTAFGGGIISSIVGIFISYFIYTMVIYFVLQQSFTIILKLSDEISNLLGLGGTNDKDSYGSLGVEKVLAGQQLAGAVSQAAKSTQGGVNSLRDKINSKNGNSSKQDSGDNQKESGGSENNKDASGNDSRENDRVNFD